MAARHEEGCDEQNILICFLVRKGLLNDDVEGARGTTAVFQEIRPGSGAKSGDFVEEKLGGAIVERHRTCGRTQLI